MTAMSVKSTSIDSDSDGDWGCVVYLVIGWIDRMLKWSVSYTIGYKRKYRSYENKCLMNIPHVH